MKKQFFISLLLILLLAALIGCGDSAIEAEEVGIEPDPAVTEAEPVVPSENESGNPVAEVTPSVVDPDEPVSSDQEPAPGQEPVAPAEMPQGQSEAVVENVEVQILESLPVQIQVLVQGYLPDACVQIEGHQLQREEGRLHINLITSRSANQRCMAAQVPFEETVPLPVQELTPGEYTVEVDGVTSSFSLSPEMVGQTPVSTEESQAQGEGIEQVEIYLVALEDAGQSGPEIGCGDSLVAVEQEIEPTRAPLRAAMQQLLSVDEQYYGQSGLYNALHQSDLQVENITIDENGLATIYLTGTYALGGVCDGPRFEAQLVETARQFSTVDEVNIFINGTPLEEVLSLARSEGHLAPSYS